MRKNVGNQTVAAQLVSTTDGSAVTTGTTSVAVTVDAGTQTAVGNATHEGNGTWTMDTGNAANTNGNHVVFTFTNSSAVSVAVQTWPVAHANDQPTVNVGSWLGTTAATPTVAGVPEVDVTHFNGTAGNFTQPGQPDVTVAHWGATAQTVSVSGAGLPEVGLGNGTMGGTAMNLLAASVDVVGNISAGNIEVDGGAAPGNGLIVAQTFSGNLSGSVGSVTANVTANLTATAVDNVWDEVITAGSHNVAGSAARFLRETAESSGLTDTAQAGAAGNITLAAGASATNDIYNGERISILEGTGAGQARLIIDYDGTSKVATVDRNWTTNPSSDSLYAIVGADVDIRAIEGSDTAADNLLAMYDGTGYAGGTINMQSNAVAINGNTAVAATLMRTLQTAPVVTIGNGSTSGTFVTDLAEATASHYNGRVIVMATGNLAGQGLPITGYSGGNLTVTNVTADAPANGDVGVIV